jgi:signal transduction histidine kinase/response regulator of citrate/malate metabolism
MRLMIVDDHAGVRQLIRQLVATSHDIVCECASGDEAIRVAPEFQPDAVTMDVRMPGSCGLKAVRAIRTVNPWAQVIIVTSHDQPDLGEVAAQAGAAGFVLKDNLGRLNEMLRTPRTVAESPSAPSGANATAVQGNAAIGPSQALLVLMVDDCPADGDLITCQLEASGYKAIVERVSTAEDLTRALEKGRWDLILTEYELPNFGGIAVMEIVRRMNLSVPALCVTGDFRPENVQNIVRAGASACIDKNNPEALGDAVKRIIVRPPAMPVPDLSHDSLPSKQPGEQADGSASSFGDTPTETKLRARIAQLEEEKKSLQNFACSVAHDLHAPLRAIRAAVATMQRAESVGNAEPNHPALHRIDEGCRRLSDRIEALLTLARLEQRPIQFQKVCMDTVLEDALSEACSDEERARVELRIAPLNDVWGDRTLLQLIFANLLSNAFKFTAGQDRPVIEIGSVAGQREATFFIKDNGTGFDMRYASRLFQPFGRLHSAAEFAGLGLGLATARHIVQRHQGRLNVEAAPTHGATFYVTLPTVASSQGPA